MQFQTSIEIAAEPERVWQILTDLPKWTEWNKTVEKVVGIAQPGQKVTVYTKLSPGRAFPVKVTEFTAPSRMVWTGGMPLGLFTGQRTYRLDATPTGTRFSMSETFSGLMAPLITKSIPDLQPAFNEMAQCLKSKAES